MAKIQDGFLLKRLHERSTEVEEQGSFQVGLPGDRDGSPFLRALQSQPAFVLAFPQIVHTARGQQVCKGAMRRAAAEWIDLISQKGQVGVRPQIRSDLLRAGFVDADLSGPQSRVGLLEFVTNLLPRQCLLGEDCCLPRRRSATTQGTIV